MTDLKAVSLFSGVGGFELGFERAGIETVLQAERDPWALKVLAKHWPNTERVTDVRSVVLGKPAGRGRDVGDCAPADSWGREAGAGLLGGVDLVYGGFPCQDLSVAGKRAGLDGERSGLWFEFHRVLRELRPRWAVIENVPGLLSSNGGRDFGVILDGLDELGFDVAWAVLDAQHFGVPQRRRRVFVVAGPSRRGVEQVLSLCEGCGGNPETCFEAGEGTTGALSAGTLRAGGVNGGNNPGGGYLGDVAAAVAKSLRAQGNDSHREDSSNYVVADTVRSHPRPGSNSLGALAPTLGVSYGVDNLAHAVTASAGHHGHSSPRGDGSDNLVPHLAYALAARDAKGTNTREGTNTLIPLQGVRRLTPLECERLMGWPDDHTRWDADGNEIADSHRYRMCGNGVVAPVAEWIGHRLVSVDALGTD